MSFIIFDTEYIADKGQYEQGFNGWKNREVIQIAAIKVSDDLRVEDKLDFYTLPVRHPDIPPYFINVTGITNEIMRARGVNFIKAYQAFAKFAQNLNCYSHGWGAPADDQCDGAVLNETLNYYKCKTAAITYFNIAPWFKFQYARNGLSITRQASGEIASLLGLEQNLLDLDLSPHNAFYDVHSILEGLKRFGFTQSDFAALRSKG